MESTTPDFGLCLSHLPSRMRAAARVCRGGPSPLPGRTMRRRVQVGVVVLLALLASGVGVIAVGRVRQAATVMSCRNNSKQFGLALQNYHSTFDHFPVGKASGTTLPPDRRLG